MSHTMMTRSKTRIAEAIKYALQCLLDEADNDSDEDTDEDTEMTPEELQMDFWDNMGEMWGYDIIGSESHPLKKAFELYCEMKKEKDEDEDEDEDDEDEEDPDRCVTCDKSPSIWACGACVQKWEDEEIRVEACKGQSGSDGV